MFGLLGLVNVILTLATLRFVSKAYSVAKQSLVEYQERYESQLERTEDQPKGISLFEAEGDQSNVLQSKMDNIKPQVDEVEWILKGSKFATIGIILGLLPGIGFLILLPFSTFLSANLFFFYGFLEIASFGFFVFVNGGIIYKFLI